jgi:hypothetical protein
MERDFVERRDDGFYLGGSRVPLDCVVREFREGQSPEAIRSDFPTLSLEQVYEAVTFFWDTRAKWTTTWRPASVWRMRSAKRTQHHPI